MAYRLRRSESVQVGIRRIARDELRAAVAALERRSPVSDTDAVHSARKSVKKARAVVRLADPDRNGRYGKADRQLQVVGRALSAIRDADVLLDTFDRLRSRYPASLRAPAFARVRRQIRAEASAARLAAQRGVRVRTAASRLNVTRQAARHWRLHHRHFKALTRGLGSAFLKARQALEEAAQHPGDESFHTWRKRVKTHWYHMRLLERMQPQSMKRYAARLHRLESLLGDDHNLAVLKDRIAASRELQMIAVERDHLIALIRRFQSHLRRQAIRRGRQIYRTTPRQFLDRLEQAWRRWRDRAPARSLDLIGSERR